MAETGKVSSKEPKSNKKPKKDKKVIITAIIGGLCLIYVVGAIIFLISQSVKSYKEVDDILSNKGYKTYFNFSYNGSSYDKNGECYKSDHSERESCKRELNTRDYTYAYMTIVIDNNFEIGVDYHMGDGKVRNITAYKSIGDKDLTSYSYIFDLDGKTDYLTYYKISDDDCYIIDKIEDSSSLASKHTCDDSKKSILISYKDEVNNKLGDIKISKKDLFAYFEEYAKKYVKPKYDEIKTAMNTKLPYAAIEKYIKSAGYEIKKGDSGVVIYDSSNIVGNEFEHLFVFSFSKEKSINLAYRDWIYDGYILSYLSDYNSFVGGDSNETCSYIVDGNTSFVNDGVLSGYCTSNDKDIIKALHTSFELEVDNMQLTRDELFEFAEEYYQKH